MYGSIGVGISGFCPSSSCLTVRTCTRYVRPVTGEASSTTRRRGRVRAGPSGQWTLVKPTGEAADVDGIEDRDLERTLAPHLWPATDPALRGERRREVGGGEALWTTDLPRGGGALRCAVVYVLALGRKHVTLGPTRHGAARRATSGRARCGARDGCSCRWCSGGWCWARARRNRRCTAHGHECDVIATSIGRG